MDPLQALAALQDELACPICKGPVQDPHLFPQCGHTFCWDCIINTLEGPGIVKSQCFVCKQPAWKKELVRNHKYDAIKESLLQLAGILQLQGHVEEAQQDEELLAENMLQQHVDKQQQDQGQQQQQQLEGCLQQPAEAEPQEQHSVPPHLTLQAQLAGDHCGHDALSLQTAQGVAKSPSHPAGCLKASTPLSAGLSEAPGSAPDATRPEAAMSSEAGQLSRLGPIAVPPPSAAAAAAAVHATTAKAPAAATELTKCCAAEGAGQDLEVLAVDYMNDVSTQQQQQQQHVQEQPQQQLQEQHHLLCCQPTSMLPGSDEQLPGSAYWQFQQLVVSMRHDAQLVWAAADPCQLQPPQVSVQLPSAFSAAVQELPTPSGHLLQRLQEDLQHVDALLADVTSALAVAQAAAAAADPAAQPGEQTAGCNGAMLWTTSVSAAGCGHSRSACCKQQNEPVGAEICDVALQHLNVSSLARQTVGTGDPCAATVGAPRAVSPGSSSHGLEEQQQEQQQPQEQQQHVSAVPDKGLTLVGPDAAAADQAAGMPAGPDAPTAKRRRLRLSGRRSGSSAGAHAGGASGGGCGRQQQQQQPSRGTQQKGKESAVPRGGCSRRPRDSLDNAMEDTLAAAAAKVDAKAAAAAAAAMSAPPSVNAVAVLAEGHNCKAPADQPAMSGDHTVAAALSKAAVHCCGKSHPPDRQNAAQPWQELAANAGRVQAPVTMQPHQSASAAALATENVDLVREPVTQPAAAAPAVLRCGSKSNSCSFKNLAGDAVNCHAVAAPGPDSTGAAAGVTVRPIRRRSASTNAAAGAFACDTTAAAAGAAAAAAATKSVARQIVGLLIDVWWKDDKQYYRAKVHRYSAKTGMHYLVYDDGDQEWLLLDKEVWKPVMSDEGHNQQQHAQGLQQSPGTRSPDLKTAGASGSAGAAALAAQPSTAQAVQQQQQQPQPQQEHMVDPVAAAAARWRKQQQQLKQDRVMSADRNQSAAAAAGAAVAKKINHGRGTKRPARPGHGKGSSCSGSDSLGDSDGTSGCDDEFHIEDESASDDDDEDEEHCHTGATAFDCPSDCEVAAAAGKPRKHQHEPHGRRKRLVSSQQQCGSRQGTQQWPQLPRELRKLYRQQRSCSTAGGTEGGNSAGGAAVLVAATAAAAAGRAVTARHNRHQGEEQQHLLRGASDLATQHRRQQCRHSSDGEEDRISETPPAKQKRQHQKQKQRGSRSQGSSRPSFGQGRLQGKVLDDIRGSRKCQRAGSRAGAAAAGGAARRKRKCRTRADSKVYDTDCSASESEQQDHGTARNNSKEQTPGPVQSMPPTPMHLRHHQHRQQQQQLGGSLAEFEAAWGQLSQAIEQACIAEAEAAAAAASDEAASAAAQSPAAFGGGHDDESAGRAQGPGCANYETVSRSLDSQALDEPAVHAVTAPWTEAATAGAWQQGAAVGLACEQEQQAATSLEQGQQTVQQVGLRQQALHQQIDDWPHQRQPLEELPRHTEQQQDAALTAAPGTKIQCGQDRGSKPCSGSYSTLLGADVKVGAVTAADAHGNDTFMACPASGTAAAGDTCVRMLIALLGFAGSCEGLLVRFKRSLRSLGAEVTVKVDPKYTQLVVVATDTAGYFSTGSKYLCMALLLGLPIVKEHWVTDSCSAGRMLPYQQYVTKGLKNTSALPVHYTEGAPTRSLAHKATKQRLFSGFTVALLSAASAAAAGAAAVGAAAAAAAAAQSHSVETMSYLLQLGGATVLRQGQRSAWLELQQQQQVETLAGSAGGVAGQLGGGVRRLVIVCGETDGVGEELGENLQQEWGTADVLIHTYITDCVLTYQLLPTLQYRL